MECIFGESHPYAHVTSFSYDPNGIPADKRGYAWAGGYYKDTPLDVGNQFYTVSLFTPDEKGRSRRRKATFSGLYVIGLDDVKEKLDLAQVQRLPQPTIVLKSSLNSEQWLYVLDKPCVDMNMVDNLHDGLITRGLAPDSKDPGQKGVTRYLRLPEGVNTKSKRIKENNGVAPKCQVVVFEPTRRYTMEQLAAPFGVDLSEARRTTAVDGASAIPDHPLINTDLIQIKSTLSNGRFDVTCPWVDEHTDADDSGTAIFTNDDGSIGFKCHHGNCEGKTGNNLMKWLDSKQPGFSKVYKDWQIGREFSKVMPAPSQVVTHLPQPPVSNESSVNFMDAATPIASIDDAIKHLRGMIYTSDDAKEAAGQVLRLIDTMNPIDRLQHHKDIGDIMRWTKTEMKEIMISLRSSWYQSDTKDKKEFYKGVMFIREMNQFYEQRTGIFYTPDAFQSAYADEDEEARKGALQHGLVQKVDKISYRPNGPDVWEDDGVTYGNSYIESGLRGSHGDVVKWLDHWDKIGWSEHRDHMLDWMAYTLQYPENKINHMLVLGGGEGTGKDFLIYPLIKAMGRNSKTIDGATLLGQFNGDYIFNTKLLVINETELGDHKDAITIGNKLKPYATAPPETLHVNPKGTKGFYVDNIVNCIMTTNSLAPFKSSGISRRYYAVWTDLNMRDREGAMRKEWSDYWIDLWSWMNDDGVDACIHYLRTRDVSMFNPYPAPPMTEFLRDIAQQSKSPIQQTLEAFIEHKAGAFGQDLARIDELVATLKASEQFYPHLVYTNVSNITPNRIMKELRTVGCLAMRTRRRGEADFNAWVLRDTERYQKMDEGARLDFYLRDRKKFGIKSVS
ncbi:DUF5906 domain-containing protein [Flavobacteriales bacterium]|nr:DUF5906 domain-containing protein [Flavobacteriales bacterium]